MKKIVLIIALLMLTGCQNPNRDFSKTCVLKTKTIDYEEKVVTKVDYNNKDEVTNVTIEKKYQITNPDVLKSVQESTKSYNDILKDKKGIKFSTNSKENFYKVTYKLHVPDMNNELIDSFNLQKNSIKYFNYMKKNNIECA